MIQLTNDYESQVFNGDIGRVVHVWNEGKKKLCFSVAFSVRCASSSGSRAVDEQLRSSGSAAAAPQGSDGRSDLIVTYTRSALGRDIALSYALTVHKAQGSEYPVVVLALLPQHANMLQRNIPRWQQLLVEHPT